MCARNWSRSSASAEPRGILTMPPRSDGRAWTFYALAAFFALYVLFLYGPMICIFVLSFQGPQGALSFPMRGLSLHWFKDLITQIDTGDIHGAIARSLPLGAYRDGDHGRGVGGVGAGVSRPVPR